MSSHEKDDIEQWIAEHVAHPAGCACPFCLPPSSTKAVCSVCGEPDRPGGHPECVAVRAACATCDGVGLVETTGPAGVPHVIPCPTCAREAKAEDRQKARAHALAVTEPFGGPHGFFASVGVLASGTGQDPTHRAVFTFFRRSGEKGTNGTYGKIALTCSPEGVTHIELSGVTLTPAQALVLVKDIALGCDPSLNRVG